MSSLPPPPSDDLPEPEGPPAAGLEPPTDPVVGGWPPPPGGPVDAPIPFAPPGAAPPPVPPAPPSFPPPSVPPPAAPYPPAAPSPPPAPYPPAPGLPAPPGGWIQPEPYGAAPPPPAPPGMGYPPPPGGYGSYQAYQPGRRPMQSYAGFWARFGASFIDGLVVSILPFVVYIIGIFSAPTIQVPCGPYDYPDAGIGSACTEPDFDKVVPFMLAAGVLYLALMFFAVIRPIGVTGQSVGCKAVNIRVVDASTGAPIGIARAFGRHIVAAILGQCCYITYLWMLWDDRKQTLHDKVVSSIVVQE